MYTRRSARKAAATEDGPPVLEKEIKEELIDTDELQDSEASQNLMSELMKQFNEGSSGSNSDKEDPFPSDFGVKNLDEPPRKTHRPIAPAPAPIIQAKLFGAAPPKFPKHLQPIKPAILHLPDRRYTLPPPKPRLRPTSDDVVGTNTSIGPLRLLAQRKQELAKRSALESYNGGRPGERFKGMTSSDINGFFDRMASTSSAKKIPNLDIEKMLQEQPSVRMEVKLGGGLVLKKKEPKIEVKDQDLVGQLKNTVEKVTQESSTQDVLISTMVMNALTTLKTRDNQDHAQFSGEIFGLLMKYGIQ